MRLSEAIRIGASWSKQAFNKLKDDNGGTCAIGAAYEGVLGTLTRDVLPGFDLVHGTGELVERILEAKFPYLTKECAQLPNLRQNLKGQLWQHIIHWNDGSQLTRDEIADRVEALELANGWTGTEDPKEAECSLKLLSCS